MGVFIKRDIMDNAYIVDFDIKANKTQTHRTMVIVAETAKAARTKFDEWWRTQSNRHAFHVKVRLKKD